MFRSSEEDTSHGNTDTETHLTQNITKLFIIITTVGLPCLLIFIDMGYSDIKVMIVLREIRPSAPFDDCTSACVWGLWMSLWIIYGFSAVSMLISPVISSLWTAFRTALDLSDTSKERDGAEISLGMCIN